MNTHTTYTSPLSTLAALTVVFDVLSMHQQLKVDRSYNRERLGGILANKRSARNQEPQTSDSNLRIHPERIPIINSLNNFGFGWVRMRGTRLNNTFSR